MNLLETIENLCTKNDENASEILAKIKAAIQSEKAPKLSAIKDGEHFTYRGIEFVRLGLEQGGVLCMTVKPYAVCAFNDKSNNDWRKSPMRKKLNTEFLSKLDENDLLPFESDLIADNGDKSYGKCSDMVGILSCDLYRKYRDFVPLFKDWMWTCTPWTTPPSGYASGVRLVLSDGSLYNYGASSAYAFAPACIFKNR